MELTSKAPASQLPDISITARMPEPRSHHNLNNFDLIRLIAALEVVAYHSLHHFGLLDRTPESIVGVLGWFPGVPIFFVVSGYLITASLGRSPSLKHYARNRALRIFPGLWGAFAVSILLLAAAGELTRDFLTTTFVPWVLAQITVVQVYNPAALRSFGTGVLNGSLWTIPVELGFYVVLPVVLALRAWSGGSWTLVLVAAPCAAAWIWAVPSESRLEQLVALTPIPYFWMFLLGSAAQLHKERVLPLLRGRFAAWLGAYVAVSLLFPRPGLTAVGRMVLLAGVTLSAAYSAPRLASRLLRGHDVSYGTYIYHMLVVNTLLWLGFTGVFWLVPLTMALTLIAAVLSWRLIERPMLRRKGRVVGVSKPPQADELRSAATT